MFKKQVPFLLAIAMLSGSAWSEVLPTVIHQTLDSEYPGWKPAPVTPQILQEFKKHHIDRSPSVVAGDFNHDGKRDYAVQIVLTTPGQEEQIIITFLAGNNGAYEEAIVQSMGIDPTTYLWMTKQDVLMVLGGPVGDTAYAYQDGKFQEMNTQEDPEHPDPTIPRPPETH